MRGSYSYKAKEKVKVKYGDINGTTTILCDGKDSDISHNFPDRHHHKANGCSAELKIIPFVESVNNFTTYFSYKINTDPEHGTGSNSLTDCQADVQYFEKTQCL